MTIQAIQNNNLYIIKFKYNPEIIQIVKAVPGRQWHPNEKVWTIPESKIGWFIRLVDESPYKGQLTVHSNSNLFKNETLDTTTNEIPNISLTGIKYKTAKGSKALPHQLDFMRYALHRQKSNMSGFLLGDDPGLGKTNESMNLAIYNKGKHNFKHCLVICCVASSRLNWLHDIKHHTNDEYIPYVLGSRKQKNGTIRYFGGSKEKLEDLNTKHQFGDKKAEKLPYFLIVNIEAFSMGKGRQHPFTDKIIELINEGFINTIIIDEVHKNMSMTSKQGKEIFKIKKKTGNNCMWIPMSGTPIVNKPTDLFLPLRLINAHDENSYYNWCQTYCVYGGYMDRDIIGYKNMDELKHTTQHNMLRRMKSEVLDLPPKLDYTVYIENSNYQQTLYEKVRTEIISMKDDILLAKNPLAKLLRLRQVNGAPELVDLNLKVDKAYLNKNAKLKTLIEYIKDMIDKDEKVIIYSNWVETLRVIYKYIAKLTKVAVYTGTVKMDQREIEKQKFMTDPKCKIIIGTYAALGTTHTLTKANNVIFYDECWTYADKQQAWDRAYRVGTDHSINIYTFITKNTIDERVHDIVFNKEQMSEYIVNNSLSGKMSSSLFDTLLK